MEKGLNIFFTSILVNALEKLKVGADLVQVYTGFIYEGPGLVKRINKAIMNQEGVNGKR